jgi:serine/threonine-protein kinase
VSASIHQLPVTIGDLTLVRRLGAGGMAEVFLATRGGAADDGSGETVVVKRMLPHLATQEAYRALFRREAATGLRVSDRHVVRTHDLVESDDGLMLVVEFIDGATLRALAKSAYQRRTPVPLPLVLRMFADAADGLAAIHGTTDEQRRPFVHRDISPDNLIVGRDGVTRVLDFGVARPGGEVVLTRTGEIRGKLPFMPPEQLDARALDGRCDLYALGVSLFWMLTGRRPFVHRSEVRLMQMIMLERAPRLRSIVPDIPVAIDELVDSLLAKDARHRPATANEVADRLHALGAGTEADVGAFVDATVDEEPATGTLRRASSPSGSPSGSPSSSSVGASSSPVDAARPARMPKLAPDLARVSTAVATLAHASEWSGRDDLPDEVVPVAETAATRSQSPSAKSRPVVPVVVGVGAGALVSVVLAGVVALRLGALDPTPGEAPPGHPVIGASSSSSSSAPSSSSSSSAPSSSAPSSSAPSSSAPSSSAPSSSAPSSSAPSSTSSSAPTAVEAVAVPAAGSSSTSARPADAPGAADPAPPGVSSPRPAPTSPADRGGRTVNVTGAPPATVWRAGGREVGRGNGALRVPPGVGSLEAVVDGGRIAVPVRDGGVDWESLPRGTLSVRAHEGAVVIGKDRWDVPARVRLVAGRYLVRFVDDAGRPTDHSVDVRAGAVTVLNLTGSP